MSTLQEMFESLRTGRLAASAAIAQLVAAGHDRAEARELVFVALGGSDLVETDGAGVARYPSGKSVEEVDRLMAL